MVDVGFVGSDPTGERNKASRFVPGIAGISAGLGAFTIALVGIFLGFYVTPFRYYDAIAVIGVAIGPALLVLFGAKLLLPGLGGPIKRLDILAGLFAFGVAVPGNYLLYLNQKLDRSSAVDEILPVEDTWERVGKSGSKSYMASVHAQVGSPLGRWSFYGSQPVSLGRAEWQRLVPGESMLTLRTHPGRFGFPWYEPDPSATLR